MNIKRNCIFLLDKEKDKTDAKLRCRIKWEKNMVAFNVGYRVDINKWIADAQRCKVNTTHGKKKTPASTINREIGRFEDMVNEVFFFFESAGHIPTAAEFRDEFNKRNGKTPEQQDKDFFACYNQFIIEQRKESNWSENTCKRHKSTMNHLKAFAPQLDFSDLTHKGLSSLIDYFMTLEIDDGEVGLKNYSVKKYINLMKWFLRWATEKGYNQELAFITFKPKLKTIPAKVIFLDWDELMKMYTFDFSHNPTLQETRDIFCFQCFTSLRYSDVQNLTAADVHGDHITITTVKTADPLQIDLNKYSKAILEKYKSRKGKVFPVPANQVINRRLKEIGQLCGIDTPTHITYYKGAERYDEIHPKYELIGTHCGRRTFICNALILGISPNIVMKWTGHSDYKAMKPYIDITDKAKSEAMNLFNR